MLILLYFAIFSFVKIIWSIAGKNNTIPTVNFCLEQYSEIAKFLLGVQVINHLRNELKLSESLIHFELNKRIADSTKIKPSPNFERILQYKWTFFNTKLIFLKSCLCTLLRWVVKKWKFRGY